MIDTSRTIDEYLALPYTDWVRIDVDEGGYYAGVVELPGCLADGETRAEALERLQDAKRSWLTSAIDHGDPVPLPLELQEYNGKILVRAPKSLHRDLAQRAALEGTSLNQLCVSYLSRELGMAVAAGRGESPMDNSADPTMAASVI